MENNLLQNLMTMLGGNFNANQKQSDPQTPLYPAEAYSNCQSPMQPQNNQNALLPLILSLFGQNNADALSNVLSGQNNDLSSMLSLISTLSKKKEEKSEQKKEAIVQESSGLLPKDELL